jgi:hypothetical protein
MKIMERIATLGGNLINIKELQKRDHLGVFPNGTDDKVMYHSKVRNKPLAPSNEKAVFK